MPDTKLVPPASRLTPPTAIMPMSVTAFITSPSCDAIGVPGSVVACVMSCDWPKNPNEPVMIEPTFRSRLIVLGRMPRYCRNWPMSVCSHSNVKLERALPFTSSEEVRRAPASAELRRPAPVRGVSGDSVMVSAVGATVSSTLNHLSSKYSLTAALAAAGGSSLNHWPTFRVVNAELPAGAVPAVIVVAVVVASNTSPRPSTP